MSYFDPPPGRRILREFSVRRDRNGRWMASDTRAVLGGVFFSCPDALRPALYEAECDAAGVHVEPSGRFRAISGR